MKVISFQVSSACLSGVHHLAAASRILGTFLHIVAAFVSRQDHCFQRNTIGNRTGLYAHRVANGSAAELQYHIFAEIIQQLVHLAGMNAA